MFCYLSTMRWDEQLAEAQPTRSVHLPLFSEDAVIRRFPTPEFHGITFYEVFAKSILNHVKPNNMGFNWTLNPFRGCSHACVYCLAGDTPVLMANGSWRPIATLEVGEPVLGTIQTQGGVRYCESRILDHWATRKSGYQIILEDGRELVASGDHRFLTSEGWRSVVGSSALQVGDSLAGSSPKLPAPSNGTALNLASAMVVGVRTLELQLPMYDITTSTGDFIANGVVSHNCFARPTHTYLDFDAGRDFETKIVVKVNAAELLAKELRKPSWGGEKIAMGTNTDNYQRAEGRYQLMPKILRELNTARNPYSILTKSTLIQRDLELLAEGASVTDVSVAFSVGSVDEEVWRRTEPGTPHPLKRLEVLRRLNRAGVPCGVLMAPVALSCSVPSEIPGRIGLEQQFGLALLR